jgi:hypothetical protein
MLVPLGLHTRQANSSLPAANSRDAAAGCVADFGLCDKTLAVIGSGFWGEEFYGGAYTFFRTHCSHVL